MPPEGHWVAADDFHLTLLPPWEVQEDELDGLKTKLQQALESILPFDIPLETIELKVTAEGRAIVWIRCALIAELNHLKERLNDVFNPKETRTFLSHITLAKIKEIEHLPSFKKNPCDHEG